MLDAVSAHVDTLPDSIRKKIVIFQSAEGTTGDEGPYKGNVSHHDSLAGYSIARSSTGWVQFRRNAWDSLYNLYSIKSPIVHLLVNCDPSDPEDAGNWIHDSIPRTWRKANDEGHGYQLNNEAQKKADYDMLINNTITSTDSAIRIRCRDEMDQYTSTLYLLAPQWYIYWTALSALHFSLDIWPNNLRGITDTYTTKQAYNLFKIYAGYKNPKYSPGAFCALKYALDAADIIIFPTAVYGSGTSDFGDNAGAHRCVNIAKHFSAYGARQDDSTHGQGLSVRQIEATGLNDVGWGIFPGNYERYLYEYMGTSTDTNSAGVGYWRIGDTSQPYGRFARGFDHAHGKDSLFFNIDDNLFSQFPNNGKDTIQLHIVYYDTTGSWKIFYDAVGNSQYPIGTITNGNSHKWKDVYYTIKDGKFNNRELHGTDIMIINADAYNKMFHLVEITKLPPN
jgi:hypothetical protein